MEKFKHDRFLIAVKYVIDNGIVKKKGDIATVFNISPSKFSEILNKRMNPGFELYQILADTFNFNPTWLLTGKGIMLNEISNETKNVEPKVQKKLYNESITKSITENITNEKYKKSYTSSESTSNPPDHSRDEIMQLLKENKKLVEEKNKLLENENERLNKEVSRLTAANSLLSTENTNLQAQNKDLSIQINNIIAENNAFKKGSQNRAAG